MFKSITKYKAQRDCATVDQQLVTTLPVATPTPALQLVGHYGPALSAEFEVLSTKLEALQRVEALFKSIEDLTTDVNDH